MIRRTLLSSLKKALTKYPVVVLTGPRQSGKTTLLNQLSQHRYVSLEDPDNREYAITDPRGFLNQFDSRVIFDEVQRTPELFSYIQGIVDKQKIMGQFILSGSQNFNLMASITQSLAGRAAIFRLFPFDYSEMKRAKWLEKDPFKVSTTGFYPSIFDRKINSDQYYANYITTYVNRDVTQLIKIRDNRSFKRFLKICATRAGQLVNYNDMARDVGVSHTTLRNWLSILETSYIIYFLSPYFKSYSKRVTKSPKLYFWDVGLLSHLLDIRKGNLSAKTLMWGNIFENLIVSELQKVNAHTNQHREYWFWRDSKGHEVDLLYAEGDALNNYEIKATTTVSNKLFDGLKYFEKISKDSIESQSLDTAGLQTKIGVNTRFAHGTSFYKEILPIDENEIAD